jgi:hypothetical protein
MHYTMTNGISVFGLILFMIMQQDAHIEPTLSVGNGREYYQVSILDSREHGYMSIGPQQYEVDKNECIYVHDVNRENSDNAENRILKFNSEGSFLYAITSLDVPIFSKVWYGPMAIDPITNDLIILGSKWQVEAKYSTEPTAYAFRFNEKGKFIEAKEIGNVTATDLLYDYDGNFY